METARARVRVVYCIVDDLLHQWLNSCVEQFGNGWNIIDTVSCLFVTCNTGKRLCTCCRNVAAPAMVSQAPLGIVNLHIRWRQWRYVQQHNQKCYGRYSTKWPSHTHAYAIAEFAGLKNDGQHCCHYPVLPFPPLRCCPQIPVTH